MARTHLKDYMFSVGDGIKTWRAPCIAAKAGFVFTPTSTNTARVNCPDCLRLVGKENEAALLDLADTDLGEGPRRHAYTALSEFIKNYAPREVLTINELRVYEGLPPLPELATRYVKLVQK